MTLRLALKEATVLRARGEGQKNEEQQNAAGGPSPASRSLNSILTRCVKSQGLLQPAAAAAGDAAAASHEPTHKTDRSASSGRKNLLTKGGPLRRLGAPLKDTLFTDLGVPLEASEGRAGKAAAGKGKGIAEKEP